MSIKFYLAAGVILQALFSFFELVFLGDSVLCSLFVFLNLLSAFLFLNGLRKIDKICGSSLFSYYSLLVLIGMFMRVFDAYNAERHTDFLVYLVNVMFVVLFLFLLYRYLHCFSFVTGISLFDTVFWILVGCLFFGSVLLVLNIIGHRWVVSFVVSFMYIPALVVYMSAIFSVDKYNLKRKV